MPLPQTHLSRVTRYFFSGQWTVDSRQSAVNSDEGIGEIGGLIRLIWLKPQERSDANFQLPLSNFFNRIGDLFDLAPGL
jgi:hypothetical protein